jgi:hypothetical protein
MKIIPVRRLRRSITEIESFPPEFVLFIKQLLDQTISDISELVELKRSRSGRKSFTTRLSAVMIGMEL